MENFRLQGHSLRMTGMGKVIQKYLASYQMKLQVNSKPMWNYCFSIKNSLACITICRKYHGEEYENRAVRVILSHEKIWKIIIKNITFQWSLLSRILRSESFPRLLLRSCQCQMMGNMLKMTATPSIYFNDDIDWSKYLH